MKRCVWLFVIALLTATSFAAGARSEPPRNVLTVEPLALLQGMFNVKTQLRVSDSNAFVFHSGFRFSFGVWKSAGFRRSCHAL